MSAGIEKTKIIQEVHQNLPQDLAKLEIVHTSTSVSGGFAHSQITVSTELGKKTFDGLDYSGSWKDAFRSAYVRAVQFVHYSAAPN